MQRETMRLRSVEIEGFRGVNQRLRFDVAEGLTVVAARNGHGKSSLLGAIEWCFFGELKFQERENATHDELVNLHHPRGVATVRTVLRRGGQDWVVERSRRTGKQTSQFSVTTPSGETLSGEGATALLFRLTGVTSEDFCRAIFLHQDSVRALLLDEPKVRDEALDRLFGLERVRSLVNALSLRPIVQAIAEQEEARKKKTDRLSGAAEQLEGRRAWHLQAATSAGLKEEDFTFDRAKARATDLTQQWNSNGLGGVQVPLRGLHAIDDLASVAQDLKDAIRKVRLGPSSSQSDHANGARLAEVRALKRQLDEALALEERLAGDTERLLHPLGGHDAVRADLQRLESQIREVDLELERLDTLARVLLDAEAYFESERGAAGCPVCETPVDTPTLRGRLRERLAAAHPEAQQGLRRAKDASKQQLQRVREAAEELERLLQRTGQAQAATKACRSNAQALLGSEADVAIALSNEERRLAEIQDTHLGRQADREHGLQAFEAEADRLILLQRLLFTEAEFARLGRGEHAPAASDDDPLDRLLALQEAMEHILRALQRAASGASATAVEASRAEVEAHYRILCDHPYFDGIRIEVTEKVVGGAPKCTYAIRAVSSSDGKTTLASTRLSTAQMNSVAISVCLAMARTLSHQLGFLILDDPSQSFDAKHKDALAGLLRNISEDTQLIVATHDEEFEAILRDRFQGAPFVRHGLEWAPHTGSRLAGA